MIVLRVDSAIDSCLLQDFSFHQYFQESFANSPAVVIIAEFRIKQVWVLV